MPAYTNSFIVIPAGLLPASLTCIRPSQLDAWPKADSGQHHSGWLRQAGCRASGPGPPIRVSSAGPVSLSRQGVSCTATQCHLSTWLLALPRPSGRSAPPHLRLQGLLRSPCSLGFQEFHVEAPSRPSNVMVGEVGWGGLDGRHQPPGRRVIIYYNFELFYIDAASSVVNAAASYGRGLGFDSPRRSLFAGLEYVQRHMNLYIWCMYLVYT